MTRQEAEQAIMEKLEEIRELALAYAPQRDHVSMYFIGDHISVTNCSDTKEEDGIIDCFEKLSDGKGIYSFKHGRRYDAEG